MLSQKILLARVEAGISLQELCRRSEVNYNTLYQQIKRGSPIPFDTVDAISHTLKLPLDYFSSKPRHLETSVEIAKRIAEAAAAISIDITQKNQRPDVATLWDTLSANSFNIQNLDTVLPYIDLYEPIRPEQEMPTPVRFGKRSLARDYLKINGESDYYERVSSFSNGIRSRAMESHARAESLRFQVDPEIIQEEIGGSTVYGYYLRATARVLGLDGRPCTAIMTQYVTSLPDRKAA